MFQSEKIMKQNKYGKKQWSGKQVTCKIWAYRE